MVQHMKFPIYALHYDIDVVPFAGPGVNTVNIIHLNDITSQ